MSENATRTAFVTFGGKKGRARVKKLPKGDLVHFLAFDEKKRFARRAAK